MVTRDNMAETSRQEVWFDAINSYTLFNLKVKINNDPTCLTPTLVSNPGGAVMPLMQGKLIVLKGWMAKAIPVLGVTPGMYSAVSMNNNSDKPAKEVI